MGHREGVMCPCQTKICNIFYYTPEQKRGLNKVYACAPFRFCFSYLTLENYYDSAQCKNFYCCCYCLSAFFIDMFRVPRVSFNPRHRILEPPLMLIIARQKCYDEDRRTWGDDAILKEETRRSRIRKLEWLILKLKQKRLTGAKTWLYFFTKSVRHRMECIFRVKNVSFCMLWHNITTITRHATTNRSLK